MEKDERYSKAYAEMATREEKIQFYDCWSDVYDQDLVSDGYGGPAMAGNAVAELYPEGRENVRILDVAAGTGLLGEELAKHGFVKVDALDASQGMLDKAKPKGVYQTLVCSYFEKKEPDIFAPDTYDVIVICGGCTNEHLPCDCLWEVVRLVKSGGYFVMATSPKHLSTVEEYKGRFEPLMDEIEKQGLWENIRKDILPGYLKDQEGVTFVYRIK